MIAANQHIEIIDIRLSADIILDLSNKLSKKINDQLLEPISKWIDDPDFMKRHSMAHCDKIDWKGYKRKQREWTRHQKILASERLKSYWREIRTRKGIRKEISKILSMAKYQEGVTFEVFPELTDNFLSPLLKPFSPIEQSKRKTEHQFCMAERLSPSEILPWKIILQQQINCKVNFQDLPQYLPDRAQDKTAKFINLLHLESDGQIKICQDEPFGQVSIQPRKIEAELKGSFIITDREGSKYSIEWKDLSDAQRSKVIADGLNKRILCKAI